MKKLPIGLSDFKEIIEEDYYYIDKTLLIDELLKSNGKVVLITRPRRFGKTLNLSMLRYFFENSEVSNKHLFTDTAIWKHEEYHELQGAYPVIFLTFKDIKEDSWKLAYESLVSLLSDEFKKYKNVLMPSLSIDDKEDYEAIVNKTASITLYGNSLQFLSRLLRVHYKKRVLVFLDEYDAPLHAGYDKGYYPDVIQFIRKLFSAALKDNSNLERGYLTGILRAAKEGVFSGLNNLNVFSLLDTTFSDKFGFTHDEVSKLLKDYRLLKLKNNVRHWYDGYRSGNTKELYNPWSLMLCIQSKGEFFPYWANTSNNELIKKLIAQSDETAKTELEDLLRGRPLIKEITDTVVIPGIENDSVALWSLLLFTGYLTFNSYKVKKGLKFCNLVIPNEEITILFEGLIKKIFNQTLTDNKVESLKKALVAGDQEQVGEILQEFVINSMSAFDIAHNEPERSYHLFVLGLLILFIDQYEVKSNRESGYGRYDIMLIPKSKKGVGIIIEFKKVSSFAKETLKGAAQKALDQINEREYAQELYQRGIKKVIIYGIAFHSKKLLVLVEKPIT